MSKQSDLISVSQGAAGDPLFIDTVNNRVGIGTSSPSYAIDTLSSGTIVAQFKRDASGGGSGGIRFGNNDKQFTLYGDSSNGLSIYDGATERMRIDTAGRVTMPYQPAFFARLNAQWTHPSGAVELGGTWVADLNVGSNYNTTTRRFTAPVAGNYQFNTTVGTVGGNAGVAYISSEIWVNGSRKYVGSWDSGGSSYNKSSASYVVALNANDYVTIASEINISVNLQEATHNTFSGYLIG